MELTPFVDSLRRDLAAAAGAVGGTGASGDVPDEVRAASERLLFALDPSVRLVLLDALGFRTTGQPSDPAASRACSTLETTVVPGTGTSCS